jgi:cysteine desulfurase family protein
MQLLNERVIQLDNNENIVYFDNAATTYPKPEQVYIAMDRFYRELGFNVGRGQYQQLEKINKLVVDTRKMILDLFRAGNDCRVVFSASATEATNIVLQGLQYEKEQNVYITHFEHNAVLRTLNYIKKLYDINIHYLNLEPNSLDYDLESIKICFQNAPPSIIIMNHVSNVCGVVTPIKEIVELGKQYNAIIVLDSAQSAGLIDINIEKVVVDYVIFAGHKTMYGPFGVGGFICDKNSKLKPLIYGGTGIDSANPELPNSIPEKFEVGSPNIQTIAGLNSALIWMKETGIDKIREKESSIALSIINCLKEFEDIKIMGKHGGKGIFKCDNNNNVGIISFTYDGYSPGHIGKFLSDNNIAVRTGLQCAPDAHRVIGTFPSGTVRVSTGYFNSEKDTQRLHNVLKYIYDNS